MFNSDDLVKVIKKAALDAVNASQPSNMIFGTVISTNPLKIKVDQKLILTSAQLVLSRNVTLHQVYIRINEDNEYKWITVYNNLNKNDTVLLMQVSGGQKYIVIDRVGRG